jgi:hypothetical protein
MDVQRRRAACALIVLLTAWFALTVLVLYPGYITIDARYVYADAKAWHFGDWQSPAMALLWRLIDPLAPGAASMFLLTASLYWLAFGLLAFVALRGSIWLALATPLLALIPPAFLMLGLIWRDVLFGVVWLLAAVLAFAASGRGPGVLLQVLALLLIGFGVLLRPNAVIAAPLLAIYAIWPTRFGLKRSALAFAPLAALFIGLVPLVYYGVIGAERQNPLHSIFVFDLGGITRFTAENQFPVQWSAEQNDLLKTECYDPALWDRYWYVQPCSFVMQRLERPDDIVFGRSRLAWAWWHAVTRHPLAYIEHRAAYMWQFLGHSNLVFPVGYGADEMSISARNPLFTPMLRLHDALQPSWLFRPGLWLLLAAAIGALSWSKRSTRAGAFAVAVNGCVAVYLMSYGVLGVAADFRYAYWAVLGTIAAGIAAALAVVDASAVEARRQHLPPHLAQPTAAMISDRPSVTRHADYPTGVAECPRSSR